MKKSHIKKVNIRLFKPQIISSRFFYLFLPSLLLFVCIVYTLLKTSFLLSQMIRKQNNNSSLYNFVWVFHFWRNRTQKHETIIYVDKKQIQFLKVSTMPKKIRRQRITISFLNYFSIFYLYGPKFFLLWNMFLILYFVVKSFFLEKLVSTAEAEQ